MTQAAGKAINIKFWLEFAKKGIHFIIDQKMPEILFYR